ncbi:MAG: hypothetical protein WKF71_01615 [Pyrinomonadaceae bacterium]
MSRKNITKNNPTKNASRERKSIPWRYRLLTLVCGLLLVVGFFLPPGSILHLLIFGSKTPD